jgi:hypothetical protein
MPATDDLTAIRQLLDVPHPGDAVTAAGRARLDELIRQEGGRQRPGGAAHRVTIARGRRIGLVATAIVVAAAAAAAAATTLTLADQGSAPPSAVQRVTTPQTGLAATTPGSTTPGSTTPGSVKQAILTAIGSVGGDIMHLTVSTTGGPAVGRGVVQYWWWPARPAPGQQVHEVFFGISTRVDVTFTEPAATPGDESLPPVSASGFFLDPAAKTWQPISQFADGVFSAVSKYLLDESFMRSTYLAHGKVVNDHAAVDGRRAIEISDSGNSTLEDLLWVDAQSYLPLRELKLDWGATNTPETRKVYDYQFLPATPANLGSLTLAIPSGYKKASS